MLIVCSLVFVVVLFLAYCFWLKRFGQDNRLGKVNFRLAFAPLLGGVLGVAVTWLAYSQGWAGSLSEGRTVSGTLFIVILSILAWAASLFVYGICEDNPD